MKKKSLIKKIVLLLFLRFFEKELDVENVEPEVQKFFADLMRPYV